MRLSLPCRNHEPILKAFLVLFSKLKLNHVNLFVGKASQFLKKGSIIGYFIRYNELVFS